MITEKVKKRIAILGGGPSALFIYKRFFESGFTDLEIHIFESKNILGAGMPYSFEGASNEHVTNVSDNEVPTIVTSIADWVQTVDAAVLKEFDIDKERFNEYKVLPRLLFGQYLTAQFEMLLERAKRAGLDTTVHLSTKVSDIRDNSETGKATIQVGETEFSDFDHVIICTGHKWPKKYEGVIKGYFDSPYPPVKLRLKLNHPVAIKGSSLTSIDAIRTLARCNGEFKTEKDGNVSYVAAEGSEDFRIVMHSRSGLLPAIRFHLEEPLLSDESLLSEEELSEHIESNGGFLSLDFVFEKDFKDLFKEKDPGFYDQIKDLTMEEFVDKMMSYREQKDAFELFREEYAEAERSIRRQESIYWKEMLAVLSYAMNYPAKYLSAEDMERLQKVLMPLISIVIAFAPQSSAQELIAMNNAGKLDIISVGDDSEIVPEKEGGITYQYTDETGKKHADYYHTFVDCVGQPHLSFDDFPFKSLAKQKTLSRARIQFRSAEIAKKQIEEGNKKVEKGEDWNYYLKVPGITINDCFQVIPESGQANERIYIMAVPYIGGYNPDYSGLDFCEEASERIVNSINEKECA